MRNQAWFDFIMKKRTHDTILRGCHFQFIWQDQEWHISSNTINNYKVKKSAGVFKLGRGFIMRIVEPRGRFGTPFLLTTAICLAEIYENYDRFLLSF